MLKYKKINKVDTTIQCYTLAFSQHPLQFLQATAHDKPCFLHEPIIVLHPLCTCTVQGLTGYPEHTWKYFVQDCRPHLPASSHIAWDQDSQHRDSSK